MEKIIQHPQNRIIPLAYLHSSECRLSQFGVFGLQSHLQGQQTALPAGGPAHKHAQLRRRSWSNTGPGLGQYWDNLSSIDGTPEQVSPWLSSLCLDLSLEKCNLTGQVPVLKPGGSCSTGFDRCPKTFIYGFPNLKIATT